MSHLIIFTSEISVCIHSKQVLYVVFFHSTTNPLNLTVFRTEKGTGKKRKCIKKNIHIAFTVKNLLYTKAKLVYWKWNWEIFHRGFLWVLKSQFIIPQKVEVRKNVCSGIRRHNKIYFYILVCKSRIIQALREFLFNIFCKMKWLICA